MTDSPEFRRQQAEMKELRGFLENTMTEKKQPDRLDVEMQRFAELRRQAALIEEMRGVIGDGLVIFGPEDGKEPMAPNWMRRAEAALAKAEAQS